MSSDAKLYARVALIEALVRKINLDSQIARMSDSGRRIEREEIAKIAALSAPPDDIERAAWVAAIEQEALRLIPGR